VRGLVKEPGFYEPPVGQIFCVRDAITMAGGFTQNSDLVVVVTRTIDDETSEETSLKPTEGPTNLGHVLQPGSIVTVKRRLESKSKKSAPARP